MEAEVHCSLGWRNARQRHQQKRITFSNDHFRITHISLMVVECTNKLPHKCSKQCFNIKEREKLLHSVYGYIYVIKFNKQYFICSNAAVIAAAATATAITVYALYFPLDVRQPSSLLLALILSYSCFCVSAVNTNWIEPSGYEYCSWWIPFFFRKMHVMQKSLWWE